MPVSSAQDRLVLFAILLEESAWLFALFGVFGLMLAGGGSPLGWIAILAIMSSSLLIARFLQLIAMPMLLAYAFQMLAGVVVVYLTVGSQVAPSFQGVDLGWIGTLASDNKPEGFTFRAVVGSLFGVVLWWRGGHIASVDLPAESLSISFKLGVVMMAVAVVVDIAHSADLNIFPMMFIFFAASLAGMSIGHVLPASRQASEERAWTRVIAGVVSAVVVFGLLFSLLQRSILAMIAAPILIVLNGMATIIFFVIILPIAYIVDFLTRFFIGVLSKFGNPGEQPELTTPPGSFVEQLRQTQEGTEESFATFLLQIGQWAIVALIILVVLIILAKAFQRRYRTLRDRGEGVRESVREDADPAYDFAKLLLNLIPSRFRRIRQHRRFRLPGGDPDIVDVFRIYFGLLTLAEERGFPRPPNETPREYQRTLESIFSADLVRMATAAFIRACYGHQPASREQIEEMRVSLEQEASGR